MIGNKSSLELGPGGGYLLSSFLGSTTQRPKSPMKAAAAAMAIIVWHPRENWGEIGRKLAAQAVGGKAMRPVSGGGVTADFRLCKFFVTNFPKRQPPQTGPAGRIWSSRWG